MYEVVLLINYEVFGNEVKYSFECLKYFLKKDL